MDNLPTVLTPTSVTVTFNEPKMNFVWGQPGKCRAIQNSNIRLVAVDGELVDEEKDKGSVG